jgi:hypothetical protein
MNATNLQKAWAAWGNPPEWVQLLAKECDRTSQREVAERLSKSGSYVNRLINRTYPASYAEAEEQVFAVIGARQVECPAFGEIPLTSCIRNRRRKGPATNTLQRTFERHCRNCAQNPDRNQHSGDNPEESKDDA